MTLTSRFFKSNTSMSSVEEPLVHNKTVINIERKKNRCVKLVGGIIVGLTITLGIIGFIFTLFIIEDEDEITDKSYCCTYEELMRSYSDMASLCYVILDTASTETRTSLQHFCEDLDQTSDVYAFKMSSEIQLHSWDGCEC